jgi:hypothetical protein
MKKTYNLTQEEFKKLAVTGQSLKKKVSLKGVYVDVKYGYMYGFIEGEKEKEEETTLNNMMIVRIEDGMLNHLNVTGLIMKKKKHFWFVKDTKENRKKAKRYDNLHFVESMAGAIQ